MEVNAKTNIKVPIQTGLKMKNLGLDSVQECCCINCLRKDERNSLPSSGEASIFWISFSISW